MAADKKDTASGKSSSTTTGKAARQDAGRPPASRKAGNKPARKANPKSGSRQRRTIVAYGVLSALTVVLLVAVLLLPDAHLEPESNLGQPEMDEFIANAAGAEETSRRSGEGASEDARNARPSAQANPEARPGAVIGPGDRISARPDAGVRTSARPDRSPLREPETAPVPTAALMPRESTGQLYFVIDDAGYSMEQLEPFLEFPGALTIAVLPQLPYSTSAALAARAAGKEVILHQPMEAESGKDPGPGALYVGDSAEQIRTVLATNLATVPGAVGMNNHMGSRATSDRATIEPVLLDTAERNLYFLDSRTAVSTVVAETARSLGLSILERNVFLDNDSDRDSIDAAIREGMELASHRGHAVMIGHVMVTELAEALHDLYPEMLDEGYELLPLSQLLSNGRDDALPSHAHTRD